MKIFTPLSVCITLLIILGLYTFYGIYTILAIKDPVKYNFLLIKFFLGNIFLPILFFLIFSFLSWQSIRKISLPFFVIFLIFSLLAFLPFFKPPEQKTARWFYFKNFSFQPIEFLKIFSLLLIAFLTPLFKKSKDYLLIILGLMAFVCFIIFKQPALSNLLIFISGIVGGFLGIKFSFRNFLVIILIIVMIFVIGLTQEYRIKRILGLLTNDEEISYQLKQSRLAISSGGILGKGLGKSEFKLIGIPLMITDAIFAIYAVETGFIGSLFLILLFNTLFIIIFLKAKFVKNESKKFFAYGLGTMISAQVYIHIFSNMVITTGVPLPFFSYGPSNAIALMIGLGIINNLENS